MAQNIAHSTKYAAIHKRVNYVRGKASAHPCTRCTGQAAHWALIHGRDGTDPRADFEPMCQSCHFAYDGVGERKRGVPRSPEARAAISRGKTGKPTHRKTSDEIARIKATLKADPNRRDIARRAAEARWGREGT